MKQLWYKAFYLSSMNLKKTTGMTAPASLPVCLDIARGIGWLCAQARHMFLRVRQVYPMRGKFSKSQTQSKIHRLKKYPVFLGGGFWKWQWHWKKDIKKYYNNLCLSKNLWFFVKVKEDQTFNRRNTLLFWRLKFWSNAEIVPVS